MATTPQTLPTIVSTESIENAARCDGYSMDRDDYCTAILDAVKAHRDKSPEDRHWNFEVCGARLVAITGRRKGQQVIAVSSRTI